MISDFEFKPYVVATEISLPRRFNFKECHIRETAPALCSKTNRCKALSYVCLAHHYAYYIPLWYFSYDRCTKLRIDGRTI